MPATGQPDIVAAAIAALPAHTRPRKSATGQVELHARSCGLTPRERQLLILVDGTRDLTALARYFPQEQLAAGLQALIAAGLILTDEPSRGTSLRGRIGAGGEHTVVVRAGRPAPSEPIVGLRHRLAESLRARVGAGADPFVERLERCHTPAELRELLPAMLALIEVVAGAPAAQSFAREAGLGTPGPTA